MFYHFDGTTVLEAKLFADFRNLLDFRVTGLNGAGARETVTCTLLAGLVNGLYEKEKHGTQLGVRPTKLSQLIIL